MIPTGFRTFHFVSFLYVFFFSFLFFLFLFFSHYFVFVFLRFVFFRFFSLLFSLFSFRFFSFRFFSFLFVFFRFSVYRYPHWFVHRSLYILLMYMLLIWKSPATLLKKIKLTKETHKCKSLKTQIITLFLGILKTFQLLVPRSNEIFNRQ